MPIRYKLMTNAMVFAGFAVYGAYRELLVFYPNLFGV